MAGWQLCLPLVLPALERDALQALHRCSNGTNQGPTPAAGKGTPSASYSFPVIISKRILTNTHKVHTEASLMRSLTLTGCFCRRQMVSALATCPSWLMLFPNETAWCLVLMWPSTGFAFVLHWGLMGGRWGRALKLSHSGNSVYAPCLSTTVYLTHQDWRHMMTFYIESVSLNYWWGKKSVMYKNQSCLPKDTWLSIGNTKFESKCEDVFLTPKTLVNYSTFYKWETKEEFCGSTLLYE